MLNTCKDNNNAISDKSHNKDRLERSEESLIKAASVLKSLSDWNKANTQLGL